MSAQISLHLNPASELLEPLGRALRQFNESRVGPYRREVIAVLAHERRARSPRGAAPSATWPGTGVDVPAAAEPAAGPAPAAGANSTASSSSGTVSDDALVGGAQGWLMFGWLFVERLWVAETHRGRGLGAEMLERLEAAAIDRGARRAALLSASWQAPGFYRKHGYETVATFDLDADPPAGTTPLVDHLLTKKLARNG